MRKYRGVIIPALVLSVVLTVVSLLGVAYAEGDAEVSVQMPAHFQDKMVFQRNKPINVNGYSENEGAVITVEFDGEVKTATVTDGAFSVTFSEREAAFDKTLTVKASSGKVLKKIQKVNIGEVWVMSGQSNAQLQAGYLEDVEEYARLAQLYPNIRLYKSPASYALHENEIGSGAWSDITDESVRSESLMSAVGYVTVAKLADELGPDIPIALVHVARGASKIITWLDYTELSALSPSLAAKYNQCVASGELPANAHGGNAVGTVLYNQQIAPLKGYNVAGVMWYQGCGDTGGKYFGTEGKTYTDFFEGLKRAYRRVFGEDTELPFYVMQLAPFVSGSYDDADVYEFKAEQYDMCREEDNCYLVSLATDGAVFSSQDVSAQLFIHPARKSPVGIRCADMILANEYGIKRGDVYTYPRPVSATLSGSVLTVTFDTDLLYIFGDEAVGFEVYTGTKWVKAYGKIEGKTVTLEASGMSRATDVRYGCGYLTLELKDGSFIEITSSSYKASSDGSYYTVTSVDGDEYRIDVNSNDVIRSLDYGNISNASGVPLVVFEMDIEKGE